MGRLKNGLSMRFCVCLNADYSVIANRVSEDCIFKMNIVFKKSRIAFCKTRIANQKEGLQNSKGVCKRVVMSRFGGDNCN